MGKSKSWRAEEVELACKAYIAVTHDSIQGAKQTREEFASKLHQKFAEMSPPNGVEVPNGNAEDDQEHND